MFVLNHFIKALDALWSMGFSLLFIAGVYFIPAIVAYSRKLAKFKALIAVNILLGWTFIVWVVCMFWAIFGKVKSKQL